MKVFALLALAAAALALPAEEKRQQWTCDNYFTTVTGICRDDIFTSGPVCAVIRDQHCQPPKWLYSQQHDDCSNVGGSCQTRKSVDGKKRVTVHFLTLAVCARRRMAAEIGLAASIIGVASAGAKLSVALYQLAEIVGSAAQEVRSIASDISIFCSVLHQLDETLQEAKATRYSLTAICTVETIIGECRHIFSQINEVVDKLKRESVDAPQELTLAWTAKVKWVFQRSKVSLYQSKLESMKTTLLLILTALTMAKRASVGFYDTLKESSEQALAQSLVITQQIALNKLRQEEELDTQLENFSPEEDTAELSGLLANVDISHLEPPVWTDPSTDHLNAHSLSAKKRNRTSRIVGGQIAGSRVSPRASPTLEPSPLAEQQWDIKEVNPPKYSQRPGQGYVSTKYPGIGGRGSVDSAWLSEAVFNDGLTPTQRHQSWANNSILNLASAQVKALMSRWVDQSKNSSSYKATPELKNEANLSIPSSNGISRNKSSLWRKKNQSTPAAPSPPDSSIETSRPSAPVAHVFKNSTVRLNIGDQTDTVLYKYLRMFNHTADAEEYTLDIEYDGGRPGDRIEEELLPQSYPLLIFTIKSSQGSNATFLVEKERH
ncbi:hypothetical protein HJFPF1_05489 [Paramyrothecium foliicola]|nr:hypothetical protein HJFPF1_05489 [Paramyrothecium foliicola]